MVSGTRTGPARPGPTTGLTVGGLAVGVGGLAGLADADAEVVQGLEDVGMAAQQPGDEHGQQQHDDAQDDGQSNHVTTSDASQSDGHRRRCLLLGAHARECRASKRCIAGDLGSRRGRTHAGAAPLRSGDGGGDPLPVRRHRREPATDQEAPWHCESRPSPSTPATRGAGPLLVRGPRLGARWTRTATSGWSRGADHPDYGLGPAAPASWPSPKPKAVKNRIHLDLRPDDQELEVERLEALGATRVSVGQTGHEDWVVLADPEGNEFCVLSET